MLLWSKGLSLIFHLLSAAIIIAAGWPGYTLVKDNINTCYIKYDFI